MTSPDERKAFGNRVLRARLEFGARSTPARTVTQEEVGQVMGVTGVAVGQWESGKSIPSLGTIQRLAFVLGVRAAWLAFNDGPMRLGESPDPPAPSHEKRA